ncbi:hypothetical protein CKO44_09020 [Rubrivivax gelatinosus]|uniref:CPBP family intramembrane glutamic endopeptidase n=1 Tax=Rubrivivax gelatinosus TaxID=28068 RepID=UPI0019080BDF|nr:CPBP family intramembrane glutamic endopeptidase [Rubrivivax gelatinosus]MBK1613611.1 hypothetical protein [Rubrivivax gelatinosus]
MKSSGQASELEIPAAELKQAAVLMAILVAIQLALLLLLFSSAPSKVPAYLGFAPGRAGTPGAWVLAALFTAVYVRSAAAISYVRLYLLRIDMLKCLALVAAVMAGVVEEVVFRKLVMDALMDRGFGPVAQVVASALAFGLAHAVWGLRSLAAGLNAVLSTTLLGGALAIVYLAAGRSLAPCVAAHVLITALIEPGLILAAIADRLGVWRERRQP